jgi:RNA polymerase sigma-70 factor (ECF subfamily)
MQNRGYTCENVAVPEDRVDQLARLSGLAVTSRDAARAAWTALVDAAHAQWPAVALDDEKLAPFVAERLAGADLDSALATTHRADLVLAAACAAGEPTAHTAFDDVLGEVALAGASTNATRDQIDEVKQMLRVQLLVARDGKPPGIAGYRGKGALRGWVRITATRELIRVKRKHARESPIERSLDHLLATDFDPALEAIKAEYRSEFAVALREAIAELGAEDRTLLRQQIVDDMSIDEIGAAFGVHRATAARWLVRARTALVAATHRRLADRLRMPVDQIASVIRLVQSKLDASVVRYLREDKPSS